MMSFDEFKRNRDKIMGREDDTLASADAGSTILKSIKRHVYEIEGYRCRTLEEVEKIALSQGIPLKDLDYKCEMIQAGAGKFDTIVRFVSKQTRQRREAWG